MKYTPINMEKTRNNSNDVMAVTAVNESVVTSSTRVCIKNLPQKLTERELKQHIIDSCPSKVYVNDLKILMRNGKSRRVAFCGFATADMASLCIDRLHGTYCGMAKLSVEAAKLKRRKEDDVEKEKEKEDLDTERDVKVQNKADIMKEKKKAEFLAAMAPRHQMKMWDNDDIIKETANENDEASTSSSSSDENDSLVGGENNRVEESVKNLEDSSSNQEYSSTRLFIRNLPYNASEDDIRTLFESYGKINEIHIPVDDRYQNKGYAFIELDNAAACNRAKYKLDGMDFMGRLLHVLPARDRPSTEIDQV